MTTTHTASSTDLSAAPSRTPLIAALGIAASAVLTAVGTFWDVNGNDPGGHSASDYWVVLPIIAVAAALVFGLVVRGAEAGNPGRRAVILSVVGALSVAAFWSGIPMVLVSGAVACALLDNDKLGSFGTASKVALALSALATAAAVLLAFTG